ncbi:alcohol dehydrogenase catalytic domain-containing protein [Alteribacillus sp. YIM 98480]|uniref:alcohol dehydrogenase catalytic domain-containing protein n=1 Tax=Alteribacillus sp. YIM 98480 TaxID=2606599 RepID=UPI00351BCCF8
MKGSYVEPGQVMGQEFSGRVQVAGNSVSGVKKGDRVVIKPLGNCCSCCQCLQDSLTYTKKFLQVV